MACDFDCADVDVVGAQVNGVRYDFFSICSGGSVCEGKGAGFGALGGPNVGAVRVAVTLDGGERERAVFGDLGWGDGWPAVQMVILLGVVPCGNRW